MFVPRNTLVAVAEIKEREKKTASGIVIPNGTSQQYKLCEVVAVGRGMATQQGERSLTDDLIVGQQVLVKVAAARRINQDFVGLESIGVDFQTDDGRDLTLVEQSQIVAIVGHPERAGEIIPA